MRTALAHRQKAASDHTPEKHSLVRTHQVQLTDLMRALALARGETVTRSPTHEPGPACPPNASLHLKAAHYALDLAACIMTEEWRAANRRLEQVKIVCKLLRWVCLCDGMCVRATPFLVLTVTTPRIARSDRLNLPFTALGVEGENDDSLALHGNAIIARDWDYLWGAV